MPPFRTLLLLLFGWPLLAQCSDAGVCAFERGSASPQNRVSLLGQYGRSGSPDELTFQSLRLEGQFRLGTATSITALVPFSRVSGPLGSASGLGDVILVLEHAFTEGTWGRLSGQVGTRFATGREDSGGLPLRYQTGLGSTDPLLGLRLDAARWEVGLGYQKAGTRSGNTQDPLQRGDDLLLHLGTRAKGGTLSGSLKAVAIQRLGKSDLRQADGSLRTLPESDRLQVNLVGGFGLPLPGSWSLEARLAIPLLKRPENTDGLKRTVAMELGASYRF